MDSIAIPFHRIHQRAADKKFHRRNSTPSEARLRHTTRCDTLPAMNLGGGGRNSKATHEEVQGWNGVECTLHIPVGEFGNNSNFLLCLQARSVTGQTNDVTKAEQGSDSDWLNWMAPCMRINFAQFNCNYILLSKDLPMVYPQENSNASL